jgi:hypothetical protein
MAGWFDSRRVVKFRVGRAVCGGTNGHDAICQSQIGPCAAKLIRISKSFVKIDFGMAFWQVARQKLCLCACLYTDCQNPVSSSFYKLGFIQIPAQTVILIPVIPFFVLSGPNRLAYDTPYQERCTILQKQLFANYSDHHEQSGATPIIVNARRPFRLVSEGRCP